MRKYDYQLCDDSGVSTAEDQAILIPIGTEFLHEYGLYKVIEYRTEDGLLTKQTNKIQQVICERLKSNKELKFKG